MQTFQDPDELDVYGKMIQNFSLAGKQLAEGTHLGISSPTLETLVGEGRYNSQSERETRVPINASYIIYGPEKTAAAQGKYSGLFGAFYFVHRPQLQLSQLGPMLLGKAGCTLEVMVSDKLWHIPLDRVNFDFITRRREGGQLIPGQITLRKDTVFADQNGGTITIPAGTPLTSRDIAPSAKREWNKLLNEPHFDIKDATGKSLEEVAAVTMLWSHINSMGIKKHGLGTPEIDTVQLDGVDDDFDAQRAMINWVKSFQTYNNIDLMPAFNGFVREASETLNRHPELLAVMADARKVADAANEVVKRNKSISPNNRSYGFYSTLNEIVEGGSGIAGAATMLDLNLPAVEASLPADVTEWLAHCDRQLRIARAHAFISQLGWQKVVADLGRLRNVVGNKGLCDKGIEAVQLIAVKFYEPYPSGSSNIREEATQFAKVCEAAGQGLAERAKKLRPTSHSAKERRKIMERLKSFSRMLKDCDYDLDNIRSQSLNPGETPDKPKALASFSERLRTARPDTEIGC